MTRADHPSGSDRIFEALEALDPERPARHRRQRAGRPADHRPDRHPRRARAARRSGGRHRDARRRDHARAEERDQSERGQGRRHADRARPAARALFHARHRAVRRGAALSPHRPLRLSPRGARALRRAAAVAAEKRERLEQLRALEAGMRIDVAIVDARAARRRHAGGSRARARACCAGRADEARIR